MVSIVIWYITVSNIGTFGKGTEREGFEPSVNKSLHSSSNATPWTTRPSLLHNDYDPKAEWIASHSRLLDRYNQSIRTIKKVFIKERSFLQGLGDKAQNFSCEKLLKKPIHICEDDVPFFFWYLYRIKSMN